MAISIDTKIFDKSNTFLLKKTQQIKNRYKLPQLNKLHLIKTAS